MWPASTTKKKEKPVDFASVSSLWAAYAGLCRAVSWMIHLLLVARRKSAGLEPPGL